MRDRALTYLRTALNNPQADFRDGQWECIKEVLENGRLLVVQRTGWGKSMVYFLATRLLRDQGRGPSLLISPLLALMRNQIEAAQRIGLRAATINSDNFANWGNIRDAILANAIDILLISPERLANNGFRNDVLAPIAGTIGLFVVDEAHCISDWGHDFRPDYRRISRVLRLMPPNLPVLATTATANDRVVADTSAQIGNARLHRGPLIRHSLRLQNILLPSPSARLAWLRQEVPKLPGSGIIYTLTVRDADRVADYLSSRGISALAYHAEITGGNGTPSREEREDMLLQNRIKALVATVALGMGFDKPDLGFVIHYQRPGSIVHYYQQVGRAGRAVEEAYGILLGGSEDDRISDYFIANAFPPEAHVAMILDALDGAPNGLRDIELHSSLNITKSQIDKALKILGAEDPAPVIKDGTRWVRTPAQWAPDTKRIQQLTALRQAEQQEIAAYMRSTECLMLQLALSLDDPHARRCGKCANCIGRPLINTDVNTDFTRDAENFLKRSFLTFEPRKKWPDSNAFPDYGFHGFIPMELRAATGRALCLWGDPGWGALVHDGKYQTGRFDDALVDACVSMLRANPFPIAPKWVTCVPSLTRPDLIPDFANRLAAKLNLPFSAAVTKAASNEPQKTMMNSWQQAHNLDGAFRILLEKLHAGPVLLIDDMVDSRWTMTVIAARLRLAAQKKGLDCPAVLPLALALNSLHAN